MTIRLRRLSLGLLALVLILQLQGWLAAVPARAQPSDPRQTARALSKAFAQAVEVVLPSVVSIRVTLPGQSGGSFAPSPSGSPTSSTSPTSTPPPHSALPLEDPGDLPTDGVGSGVIVSASGLVVTNNHVLPEQALEISVRLSDKRTLKADVLGRAPEADLALLQLRGLGSAQLLAARFGAAQKLSLGEWVIAAGSPLGLEHSITAGIVSATQRVFPGNSRLGKFIQTDTPINPGNSGGPLVNLDGEVVGINTAIFSRTGGYMGIGFAIPAERVQQVMQEILNAKLPAAAGSSAAPSQSTASKSARTAATLGLTTSNEQAQLQVLTVEPGGIAQAAGITPGDLLLEVCGQPCGAGSSLDQLLAGCAQSQALELVLQRAGRKFKLRVLVAG
jgi:serine protease Do